MIEKFKAIFWFLFVIMVFLTSMTAEFVGLWVMFGPAIKGIVSNIMGVWVWD